MPLTDTPNLNGRRQGFRRAVASGQVDGKGAGWLAGLEFGGHPNDCHRMCTIRDCAYDLMVAGTERAVQCYRMPGICKAK